MTLVDIDAEQLKQCRNRVQPIINDYIVKREQPFRVEVFTGSVDYFSSRLQALDAFVAIELIEHLYPAELERLPYNVFHLIRPQIAIFTTPNSDYNPLFATLPAEKFRHDDHKFEWSREEFRDWAENLIERFPQYSLSVQGIGPPPVGAEVYGCCSQAAVFIREEDPADGAEVTAEEISYYNSGSQFGEYELIAEQEYPYDERTRDEKICDLAKYHINQMEHRSRMEERDDYSVPFRLEIDLERLVEQISGEYSTTVEELKDILKVNNVTIEEMKVIVVSDVESEEEYSE
ncbi:Small RNA 2'-O-methyltransferase [Sergentomyia squamirostris]